MLEWPVRLIAFIDMFYLLTAVFDQKHSMNFLFEGQTFIE